MIVEHEIIENIEDTDAGMPMPWVCKLIRSLGRDNPKVVLHGMWCGGHLSFVKDGQPCKKWECKQFLTATSVTSGLNFRVEVFQFYTCVIGGKLPVNPDLFFVSGRGPRLHATDYGLL